MSVQTKMAKPAINKNEGSHLRVSAVSHGGAVRENKTRPVEVPGNVPGSVPQLMGEAMVLLSQVSTEQKS